MATENQIAVFAQRLLHSKLHIPSASGYAATLCGRQLNNRPAARAQVSDKIELAHSLEEFTYQLLGKRACRHCGIKAGLLVRTTTVRETGDDSEGEE